MKIIENLDQTRYKLTNVEVAASSSLKYRLRIGVLTSESYIPVDSAKFEQQISNFLRAGWHDLLDPGLFSKEESKKINIGFSIISNFQTANDRFVARQALSSNTSNDEKSSPDTIIEPFLPMSPETFINEQSEDLTKKELEELFKNARLPFSSDSFISTITASTQSANQQDAQKFAIEHILNYCDVLLVFGEMNDITTEIDIHYVLEQEKIPHIHITEQNNNFTIKNKDNFDSNSVRQFNLFSDEPIPEGLYKEELKDGNKNFYRVKIGPDDIEEIDQELLAPYIEEEVDSNDPKKVNRYLNAFKFTDEDNAQHIQEKLIPHYIRASYIAARYQERYFNAGKMVYIFAPLSVAAVAIGVLAPAVAYWAFFLEFLLLGGILGLVKLTDKQRARKRWMESRYLAERLRVAIHLAAVGIEPHPTYRFRRKNRNQEGADWASRAFQEIWENYPIQSVCKRHTLDKTKAYINYIWLKDQYKYHQSKIDEPQETANFKIKAKKARFMNKRLEVYGVLIFFVAMLAAALHSIPHFVGIDLHVKWFDNFLIFLGITLPGLGAALGGYRAHKDYARTIKNSENMLMVIPILQRSLRDSSNEQQVTNMLHTTEDVMLQETQGWLSQMNMIELEASG